MIPLDFLRILKESHGFTRIPLDFLRILKALHKDFTEYLKNKSNNHRKWGHEKFKKLKNSK